MFLQYRAIASLLASVLLGATTGTAFASISSSFAGGELTVSSDAADPIVIGCASASVTLNAATPPSGPVLCASVVRVVVNGGPGANIIALDGIAAADFPQFTGATVDAGDGGDSIVGSFQADTLRGGPDNDTIDGNDNPVGTLDQMLGEGGDDTLIWNPGKDDDLNEGGPGNDTAVVNGGGAAETFTIGANAGRVRFDRTAPAPFFVDIGSTERLVLNANGGNDGVSTTAGGIGLAALIALEINGGTGDDTLTGGDGADILRGGPDNDTIDGNDNPAGTLDQMLGEDGDDTLIWNPGKDDDLNEGGPGNDTAVVNGGGGAETFTIGANAGRVRFDRTAPTPFFVDIGSTERLVLNANGGNDGVSTTAGGIGLAALIALEINGGTGDDTLAGGDGADILRGGPDNDTIDGNDNPAGTLDQMLGEDGDDTLIWNPGKDDDLNEGGAGNDVAIINAAGASETFLIGANAGRVRVDRTAPTAFFVDIGSTERLRLNASGGDDQIATSNGGLGLAALIALEINGGDGNDSLTGGDGADILRGGPGSDVIDGNDNPAGSVDQMLGDDGDDTLIWNPGKDDDLNDGGPGNDTSIVNGAGAAETFLIAQVGTGARLDRTLPTRFFVDMNAVENLQLNANGGADAVNTEPLSSTAQLLAGGDPGTVPGDVLVVDRFEGSASVSPINVAGFAPIVHQQFEATFDGKAQRRFTARLEGSQVVPPTISAGIGRGFVVLSPDRTQATVRLRFSALGSASTLAQINAPAAAGSNAPPLFDLPGGLGGTSGEFGPSTFTLTPAQAAELESGLWYFNVRSSGFADGEIRGQILADRVFESFLSPRQVVPAATSTATGTGTLTLAGPRDEIVIALRYSGLVGDSGPGVNTSTRVHGPAPRGSNAAPIAAIPLPASGTDRADFVTGSIVIDATQAAQIEAGLWYFNVNSVEFPDGELRGQIDDIQFQDGFEGP